MNSLFKRYPNGSSIVLGILVFSLVFVLSGLANAQEIKKYFPYGSCMLLIIATWFLYKIENRSLQDLGLDLRRANLKFLFLGILVGVTTYLTARSLMALYLGQEIKLSGVINVSDLILAFYFILPQVMTEELLFRGYLFNKTILMSNVVIANIIFSVVFTLVHVMDEDVLSNLGMVLMLVVSIPVGHILFAMALLKSKTLWFPIGLHLGNNWATRHLISTSKSGESIFYIDNITTFETWFPFISTLLIHNGCFVLLTILIWKWDLVSSYFERWKFKLLH